MLSTCFRILLSTLILRHVSAEDAAVTESSVHLYEKGVESYLENNFAGCVENFEKALKVYHVYVKKLQYCRLKCKNNAILSEPLFPIDIDNLLFYERAIRQTLCIIECEKENPEIRENYNVNPEVEQLFQENKPYEYLHLCYYQTKNMQKAAAAAYTYLLVHPDDKVMENNLQQYLKMEEVDAGSITNLEAKDFVYLYTNGAEAYENKDWKQVITYMEESLSEYLQADEECRAQCEGPFDHGWYPDFIPSISNHFTVCLKCKHRCKHKLSSLNGEVHEDLLPSHYHYLQYAYFKLGNLKAACQAVASYLLFYPDDETMLSNKRYYLKQPKGQLDFFQPSEEAVHYMQRNTYEARLLKFITKEFTASPKPVEVKKSKFRITLVEKELGGRNRFVSDGLISRRQCRSLVQVARFFAVVGDGYQGKRSPHTMLEKFEGLTLTRALFLVYFRLLHTRYLEMYLNITEETRKHVKDYFNITDELYFAYTHLVCRSALADSPMNRTDMSHKIHADNCNILKNGTCEKSPPSYTWRDYSAIVYLNDDFEGGEFIFASDLEANHIQSSIKPKCGRMIAFSSGGENLHGVKAVKKGSRCALGIWFTLSEDRADHDRKIAFHILENNINFDQFSRIDISNFDAARIVSLADKVSSK